jgi:hypothetical protein
MWGYESFPTGKNASGIGGECHGAPACYPRLPPTAATSRSPPTAAISRSPARPVAAASRPPARSRTIDYQTSGSCT